MAPRIHMKKHAAMEVHLVTSYKTDQIPEIIKNVRKKQQPYWHSQQSTSHVLSYYY